MGLFKRKVRPAPRKTPLVFVTDEEGSSVYRQTRVFRFFFKDTLILPSKWEKLPDGSSRSTGLTFLPDRDAYMSLVQQLRDVTRQDEDDIVQKHDFIRCYPHYIAVEWDLALQPEDDDHASSERIEREVVGILTEYFGWEVPVEVGRFRTLSERYEMAQKLGVSWSAGSFG